MPARWHWLLAAVLLLGAAGVAVLLLRPAPAPPPPAPQPSASVPAPSVPTVPVPSVPVPAAPPVAPTPVAPPAPASPPGPPTPLADEATILADRPETLTAFRFAADPAVVVLDFPSLEQQGRMLDRVAALEEKAAQPRDRVLSDAELAAAIRASGATVATYYYGHDYPANELARFFALADRDHVALDPEEERLRAMVRGFGWLAPGAAPGALISLSRQGADADITPQVRAAILHHELSHGAFFAEPAYAEYTRQFWRTALTPAERDGVRRFLGANGYDTGNEELMLNEMQAYVMFTPDPGFFVPSDIGITAARRAALQAAFGRDLPLPWLRAALPAAAASAPVLSSPSSPRPRAAAPH
jgi:hypothetical protein